MINIFLAYSGRDKELIVDNIIVELEAQLSPHHYKLWYYHKEGLGLLTMDSILKKLSEMDLFIIFITENSMSSPFVKIELDTAMTEKNISGIYGINIDCCINPQTDQRISDRIRQNIYDSRSEKETILKIITILQMHDKLRKEQWNHDVR